MTYCPREFANNEIYHIVIRAIDNNLLFKDINDHFRGIFSFYEFNNLKPASIQKRRRIRARLKKNFVSGSVLSSPPLDQIGRGAGSTDSMVFEEVDERDKMVEILVFALMPNHLHLLLRQIKNEGITKFMSKNGTGLGGYLNRKYPRKGPVFEDRFKSVHIKGEIQLKNVVTYIHINPLSIIEPGWKESGIKDPEKTLYFLFEEYRWSSLFDYIGKKNFPSVIEREFILNIMGGVEGIKKDIENWVYFKAEIGRFPEIHLE